MIYRFFSVLFIAFCCVLSIQAQEEKRYVIGELPAYKVAKTTDSIIIDGKREAAWDKAQVVSFDYFYRSDKPYDMQTSTFRMMWDNRNIYLYYEAQDTALMARETNYDGRPYLDDCAEFFVVPIPDSVNMHLGFEINIIKSVYDYVMVWQYYNKQSIFLKDYNPVYPVGITYDGTINDESDKDKGWTMEIAIPFSILSNFHNITRPRAGAQWAFQAVRQDRNLISDRFRSTSTLFPIYDARLDVHQPNRFGIMEFQE